jgi:diacylglycerol O-acyltransferase
MGSSTLEPLSGLDSSFLAMETATSRFHVAGILLLDPPEGETASPGSPELASRRFDAIRAVVGERVHRVPRLLRRPVRAPLDVQRAVWIDEPEIDVDAHVRRASVAPPGGRRELDALVGEVLSQPLPVDRPLWEMVVAEGLEGGRTAVIARLHHAILDGVSGATAMAAFLDPSPGEGDPTHRGAESNWDTPADPRPAVPAEPDGSHLPSAHAMWRYAATSLLRHPDAALALFQRSADALAALNAQNRELASRGLSPPPAPFTAPRSCLNGSVTGERCAATFSVPLADLELVRQVFGGDGGMSGRSRGATVNDVILAAVGGALREYLTSRGAMPSRSLVALVPVSTRGPASVPSSRRAHVGNYVSGMLVPLASNVADPVERLGVVASGSAIAKCQENEAGGDFLETLFQAVPPAFLSGFMRTAGRFSLFDRLPPLVNVVVSSVVVPDVSLWWAGCPVSAVFPTGPVAEGVGLNITSMTYNGVVHFGIVGCPRLVPDVGEVASLLDDALAELVVAALAVSG